MNAKEITVTLTVHLCPAERRALGYKRLRALYGVPQPEAALEAQAVTRGTAHDHIAALVAQEIDRLTDEYLTAKQHAKIEHERILNNN